MGQSCLGTIVSGVNWGNRKYSCGYALDESGPEPSRSHILLVLGSSRVAKLPSSFRLLVTSQSLPDIQAALGVAPHVKAVSLDDVPVAFSNRDIRLFVSVQLKDLGDIREREVNQIAQKADGLFEWACLACEYIRQDTTGELVKECFSNVTVHVSREGKSLLDNMYHTILESVVSKRPTALVRFCSVIEMTLGENTKDPTTCRNSERIGVERLGQRPKMSLNGEPLGAGLHCIYTTVHKGYVRLSMRLPTVQCYVDDVMVELRLCDMTSRVAACTA